MNTKMKTALKILSVIALTGCIMPLTGLAAIISSDGQLPTFYVFADAETENASNDLSANLNWKFEPVLDENSSPVAIRVLTPELETAQVATPAIVMALSLDESAKN
jgi:hypothetical protein